MLLVLLVGGFLAYKTRGHSKNSNFEGVRAYIYLDALLRGYSPQGANSVVHHRLTTAYAESVRSAWDAIKNLHEGRHLDMLGYAYRRGMQPLMPRWYYNRISIRPMTPLLKSIYEMSMDTKDGNTDEVPFHASGNSPKASAIPKMTEKERVIANEAVEWCKGQIGIFLGAGPQSLPDYGLHHDILVASYICGFIQGQNIVHKTLEKWSDGDDDLAMIGFVILVSPAVGMILGLDRSMKAMVYLPQLGPATTTDDIQLLDEAGGSDGMDHAHGKPKQNGGMLKHYLVHNIAPASEWG